RAWVRTTITYYQSFVAFDRGRSSVKSATSIFVILGLPSPLPPLFRWCGGLSRLSWIQALISNLRTQEKSFWISQEGRSSSAATGNT
ncbi:unnamed protein product, partial [Musa acuminata subsp. burmannicoides]